MHSIIDKINNSKNILVLSHTNPDGDAMGSSLGLYNALLKLNKNVDLVMYKNVPDKYSFINGFNDIKSDTDKDYNLTVVVDTATEDRINVSEDLLSRLNNVVVIDHHISNSKYGEINYIDPVAACAINIYKLINDMNIELDELIATPLLSGILTDTGGFSNNNTDALTFDVVSNLIKVVNYTDVYKKVLGNISFAQYNLKKITMDNLKFYCNNKIAYSYVREEDIESVGATHYDTATLVNVGREIEDVEVSIFAKLFDDGYRLSLRSKNVDVNLITNKFGGGGHKYASGITLTNKDDYENTLNELIRVVEDSINEWINSSK